MTNTKPGVSVIICCYSLERFSDVKEAIESVLVQSLKSGEIIVVVDHNKELFQKLQERRYNGIKLLLSSGTPGLSAARNVGVEAAGGEIIAFLDDDAVAEKDWLEKLTEAFLNKNVMATGGEALPRWKRGFPPAWFPLEFDFVIGCTNHKRLIIAEDGEIRNVTGSNMAFRREVFEKAGPWEVKLGRNETGNVKFNPAGGEEAELCLRIKAAFPEGKILFAPQALVHHKVAEERTKLRYMLNYCVREGVTRAIMQKIVSGYKNKPLAAEGTYLRRLLFRVIPGKLIRFYRFAPLLQAGVICVNLSLIACGYVLGKWQYRRESV